MRFGMESKNKVIWYFYWVNQVIIFTGYRKFFWVLISWNTDSIQTFSLFFRFLQANNYCFVSISCVSFQLYQLKFCWENAKYTSDNCEIKNEMFIHICSEDAFVPANMYLFKVNNRNTRKRCEICSKWTIKTPELVNISWDIKIHTRRLLKGKFPYRFDK